MGLGGSGPPTMRSSLSVKNRHGESNDGRDGVGDGRGWGRNTPGSQWGWRSSRWGPRLNTALCIIGII